MSEFDYKAEFEKLMQENARLKDNLYRAADILEDYKMENAVLRGKLEIVFLFLGREESNERTE